MGRTASNTSPSGGSCSRAAFTSLKSTFVAVAPRLPLDDLPDCNYYALVARVEERPRVGVWPVRLRDQPPTIPIPLRAPDPDARLDLQQLLHRLYDAAG